MLYVFASVGHILGSISSCVGTDSYKTFVIVLPVLFMAHLGSSSPVCITI